MFGNLIGWSWAVNGMYKSTMEGTQSDWDWFDADNDAWTRIYDSNDAKPNNSQGEWGSRKLLAEDVRVYTSDEDTPNYIVAFAG